jgi:hypothetical protein
MLKGPVSQYINFSICERCDITVVYNTCILSNQLPLETGIAQTK